MAKLVIFKGDAVESELRLTGTPVRIGRHNRNDVVLDDGLNGVSRFHAEIRPEGNTYCIVDLDSRNGVWINGRRIKDRATLSLGVPVTVGAFELALEDDVSTIDFQPAARQETVVSSASGSMARQNDGGGSAPRSGRGASRRRAPMSPVLLWSAAAVGLIVLCAVTYAVFRYSSSRQAPAPVAETTTTTAVVAEVPPPPPIETPEELARKANAQDLADAQALIAAGQATEALRDKLQPLLERDPENAAALDLKRQIEQAAAAASRPKAPPAPVAPSEPEIAGIIRRPNELYADYQSRARRLEAALADGKNSFDKQDYATAVARFRAVENEQPKYQGVDALLADALARQQKVFDEAINNGQLNELANKLKVARQWYERALELNPGSTSAKENLGSVMGRMNAEATNSYNRATFAVKSGDNQVAIRNFQQILDLLLPGDELWEKAKKESEALKR